MKLELDRFKGGQSLTSRLSFRAKLLLVLFVPFLALVVVAAAGLSDRFADLHAQEQYGDLSGPLRSLDTASRALQNESVVSSWFAASGGAPAAELAKARGRTDAAVKAFRADEQAFAGAGLSPAAIAALEAANRGFDQIPDERAKIDGKTAGAADARNFFLGVDDHVLDFGERVARDLASADVAASLTRVFSLERSQHELARGSSVYIAVLASGSPQDFSEWVGAQAAQAEHLARFDNTATAEESAAFAGVMGAAAHAPTELPSAFPAATQTPAEFYVDYTRASGTLDRAINAVEDVINRTASAHASSALREVRIYGGLAAFAMLLTLLLIWFVSRAVVGPVRRLTAAAREMSQRQLPALVESLRTGGDLDDIKPIRIEVQSEDEIGELAQAFNDVEAVTFQVAQEQSQLLRKGMGDLFVNLARRNQSLVQRQLELLDDLERNEHDPAALDALFKLDHMATRMRRNAESLLVLSGAEQPRQWQQPIALIDVVRAAAAEIADFPRVELVGIDDDLAVSGRAVSDVAHLLAELLENATSFSPPEAPVVVSGAVSATGFVLAVSDQGIGMTPERIADANKLLADPPVVGLALSRALGLHVVGSLAARHGITVELRAGAPGGLVALVALPTAVLEPRPVSAPAAPVTGNPVYSPDLDDHGSAEPLGARRLVSRPPDEPPVEEWRWEGLAEGGADPAAPVEPAAPSAPSAPTSPPDVPTFDAGSFDAGSFDSGSFDTGSFDSGSFDPGSFDTGSSPATAFEASVFDTGAFETTSSESPVFDLSNPPVADVTPPVADVIPPVAGTAGTDAPASDAPPFEVPAFDSAPFESAPFDSAPFDSAPFESAPFDPTPSGAAPPPESGAGPDPGPGGDEGPFHQSAPLPTRVPGQHLSHHPRVVAERTDADVDPMRAYRVHELLTRHAQGKRRGQAGEDFPTGAAPVPGAPASEEDGR